MFRIGDILLDRPVALAPMEDVSDLAFRRLCKRFGDAFKRIDPEARTGFEGAGRFGAGDDIDHTSARGGGRCLASASGRRGRAERRRWGESVRL